MKEMDRLTLPERTADAIRYMLHTENYRVGAKLPNEPELARRFEVSRATVRKSLDLLRDEGLLVTRHGSGTFMAEPDGGTKYDPLGLSLIADKRQLMLNLLDLRMMIEPRCAMLAAQNASRRDTELLIRLCNEFEALIADGQSYVRKDMELHQAIANCSGNAVIHNLIPYIHQMQMLNDRLSSERRRVSTPIEHRRIVKAICQHRGADAFDNMQYHLSVIRERFLSSDD